MRTVLAGDPLCRPQKHRSERGEAEPARTGFLLSPIPSPHDRPVPDGDDLRDVMRRFPTGSAVVTVNVDGTLLGQTVSALVSLSLDPPLVGISIAKQAQLHELLREAGGFAVSLLAGGQEYSQHFARSVPSIAMWHGVAHHEGSEAPRSWPAPSAGSSAASGRSARGGDHTLFVGEVLAAELASTRRRSSTSAADTGRCRERRRCGIRPRRRHRRQRADLG